MSIEARKTEYEAHTLWGQDYYNGFRAQLTIDIEGGVKTLEECIEIHKRLKSFGEYLWTGDIKSAYSELTNTLPNVFCTSSILESHKSSLITYISENYTW